MKLFQYNEYLVCTVDTDHLVFNTISSYSYEYTPIRFRLLWFKISLDFYPTTFLKHTDVLLKYYLKWILIPVFPS